jgi:hypothetical protein
VFELIGIFRRIEISLKSTYCHFKDLELSSADNHLLNTESVDGLFVCPVSVDAGITTALKNSIRIFINFLLLGLPPLVDRAEYPC